MVLGSKGGFKYFFMFTSTRGDELANIFQKGWNHQLVYHPSKEHGQTDRKIGRLSFWGWKVGFRRLQVSTLDWRVTLTCCFLVVSIQRSFQKYSQCGTHKYDFLVRVLCCKGGEGPVETHLIRKNKSTQRYFWGDGHHIEHTRNLRSRLIDSQAVRVFF